MKILTLTPHIRTRIDRVTPVVNELHYIGEFAEDLLTRPRVAIVGSRKPTPYGLQMTEKLATDLSRAGVVIVSGLAFGVDITAHKAALSVNGSTIAVLPSDLEKIYPATHARIAREITEKGALISEYTHNPTPRAHDFLDRNRIIAGISDMVIVTEAAERSGSLNTASHAKSLQIPIGAVPGPATSTLSSGTNWLLKQGAQAITSATDILEVLQIQPRHTTLDDALADKNDLEQAILRTIQENPSDTTVLCKKLNLPLQDIQTALTMLEIAGDIKIDSVGVWHIV